MSRVTVIAERPRMVLVEWIDSRGNTTNQWTGWQEALEMDLATIQTLGFLLKQDDDKILVAGHIEQGHMVGGEYTIPKICIKRIVDLTPKRVR